MINPYHKQLELFKSLFKGRSDVFATRWEKDGKSGYMPVYSFDPYRFMAHKRNGGTFQNYPDKSYLALSDEQYSKHLNGEQLVGLYPLLEDNTSWFILADFDEKDWISESVEFIKVCRELSIPAYLERSRSGNGGHVWIFFDQPYPAHKSRSVITSLLTQSGAFSSFDKNSSFDRLFPNQDRLTGKGLGNLIALPLYKSTLVAGNSCFIDLITHTPFQDQWQFLKGIERTSTKILDSIFSKLSEDEDKNVPLHEDLEIVLANKLILNANHISLAVSNFLKEELNIFNTAFIVKKNSGRNTYQTKRFFNLIEQSKNLLSLPRGFAGKLIRFCRDNGISYRFTDKRKRHASIAFTFNAALREYQLPAVNASDRKDIGVIVAPPGSGKTVIALKIVADKHQPTLIIVHRKQLAEQWAERIEAFLGIPKKEIGKIVGGKVTVEQKITIATIQSLSKSDSPDIFQAFGLIIVDECHHVSAETFHDTLSKFHPYYCYGLTATPFRKYSDGKLIFVHLGEVIAEIKSEDIGHAKRPEIIIRNTSLDVPFNEKTDRFETLSKMLVHDSVRNRTILADVSTEVGKGKRVVILTERKEHIDSLYQYLKQTFEALTLSGDDTESDRASKWKQLKAKNYQILITTGQYFGEGTDLDNAHCLFLVYPFSFEGKLIQYMGRVQRSETTPTIYDYRDINVGYLNRMFLKRNIYYRRLAKQRTLFDLPEDSAPEISTPQEVSIQRTIRVPIQSLEFLFGGIQFTFQPQELQQTLTFDIENLNIRPEFDVLKPYFERYLKSKTVEIDIHIIVEKGVVVAQSAESEDINKFNREVVEAVRFRFSDKMIFKGNRFIKSQTELNQEISNGQDGQLLYQSAEELLVDALAKGNYKHQRQLRYLSKQHDGRILKIRFVMSPFAFVFLLGGEHQYHIVMETLDTEEATYIWHVPKSVAELKNALQAVENDLNKIRNDGRQEFLKSTPTHFSRILHDYSDDRKGFVIWKDDLEERLV
ncbi:TOTE conflict system archaeo-eukaryotic primase domain-containing protein [Dyadobacter sp. 22481]|uniref:TOTE conflict system archaeo-eukaryotic primase domain-containing protein n=1 Tax=Dyadobacter sp. 22481 TaxID=3453926 RepID=UPI003F830626